MLYRIACGRAVSEAAFLAQLATCSTVNMYALDPSVVSPNVCMSVFDANTAPVRVVDVRVCESEVSFANAHCVAEAGDVMSTS